MKTEKARNREEKEKFKIPRRVQDTVPIKTVWPDGTFLVGNNRYSRTYQFRDINYAVASNDDNSSFTSISVPLFLISGHSILYNLSLHFMAPMFPFGLILCFRYDLCQ